MFIGGRRNGVRGTGGSCGGGDGGDGSTVVIGLFVALLVWMVTL